MSGKLISILLLVSGFSSYAQSQVDYNAGDLSLSLKNHANAVIRNMETMVDMHAPNDVILRIHKAITILNKNGDEKAVLALFYNKNTGIKDIKGVIYDAAGQSVSNFSRRNFTDESAISDFSLFEDERVMHYTPHVVSYPYTVVYDYEIRNKQNLIIPDWYANPYPDVAVIKNSYTFICKPDDQLNIKEYNYPDKAVVVKNQNQTAYTWTVTNLQAFKKESWSPDPDDYRTCVKIAPENFIYYHSKGTYKNWDELGRWTYNGLLKSRQMLSPNAVQEVKDLVKDVKSDKDKAKVIYEYMKHKTRYISVQIGIGGFQPMLAGDVDRLAYGDCKALVNYMQSLLKAVDIPSYYCVVNAGNFKKNMDPDFASMNQGNHIILCLPFKNDTTWLECTSQESPFGYLGSFTDDRTVLACTENGGKLLKTPALTTQMNLTKRHAELILEKDGTISGKMNTVFSGAQYDNYEYLIHQPNSKQLKLLKEEYDIDNINFEQVKFNQDKGETPSTSESLNLTIDRYVPKTSNHIYLVINLFNKVNSIPEVTNRTLPVYINRGYTDEDELVYHIPEGYTIEAKPADTEIKSPFGTYYINVRLEGNKLTYNRKFVLNNGTYPADKYAELVSFMESASNLDQSKVVFKIN